MKEIAFPKDIILTYLESELKRHEKEYFLIEEKKREMDPIEYRIKWWNNHGKRETLCNLIGNIRENRIGSIHYER